VEPGGWDNRTFRLGEDLCVRLPSAERYAAQVEKEHRWLPRLAPRLPLPVPVPVATGRPDAGFPWPWSIRRWIEGEPATPERVADPSGFAAALAGFLAALERIDPAGGPGPGPHNFLRGGPLGVYDGETRAAIEALHGEIEAERATSVWESALESTWDDPGVWVHGDVSPGNLLLEEGRLTAVIDFGCLGVGDPACDLAIAWSFLSEGSRATFRAGLALDDATWERARGWALWKALVTLVGAGCSADPQAARARCRLLEVLRGEPA
jgi:aminoglycoside phosphotransferase (APT) family kinase protein